MNKVNNVFGQILQLFPRSEFIELVYETKSEKGSKGFSSWSQFVANMFCQLGGANSLREICIGLASSAGKLIHLGLRKAPCRSTLSYANKHRPWELYEKLFYRLLDRTQSCFGGKHKFRFKNKLLSFDASIVELCIEVFDWAKFRKGKGAAKLHLLLDHSGYLPKYVHITDGKTHEVNVLKTIDIEPGTIVAMDRGLVDYGLFGKWTRKEIYFVTRLKENADYKVLEKRKIPKNRNILRDEIIEFKGVTSKKKCPYPMRIVEAWSEEHQKSIILLTNHLQFGASTISSIYKDRWQIELFFKAIKQNLRIKTFIGTSKNAVMIQIWTALISILILKYIKAKSKIGWSLSNLVAMLRYNLDLPPKYSPL